MSDDIRKSQLVGSFGVGSLRVQVGGLTMICAGLDHWFQEYTINNPYLKKRMDPDADKLIDIRLQRYLNVDFFKEPPEWRDSTEAANAFVPVPFFRFPKISYCSNRKCSLMDRFQESDASSNRICNKCSSESNFNFRMYQVNLVVACKNGHLDEFPWEEWAHNDPKPTCGITNLKFIQGSGTGVQGQKVKCTKCGKSESLIKGFQNLNKEISSCKGGQPWHGASFKQDCNEIITGLFVNQTILYQPLMKTSLFIPPPESSNEISELLLSFSDNRRNFFFDIESERMDCVGESIEYVQNRIDKLLNRNNQRILTELSPEPEDLIRKALLVYLSGQKIDTSEQGQKPITDKEFRYHEYTVLSKASKSKYIRTKKFDIKNYSNFVQEYVNNVVLIDSILQTRALAGFNRRGGNLGLENAKEMLWRTKQNVGNRWLPAVRASGEGIFLEFNLSKFSKHINSVIVQNRLKPLIENLHKEENSGYKQDREIRFGLLFVHTLSHLLINEIAFEAGYSAASVSERLYVSNAGDEFDMTGLLIYTSQGDVEGTMGGLVSLGEPERFNILFENAIRRSLWCSTDPVCNETGTQGPGGLNIGACYACALLPETSCETFNLFLDRGVIVGTQQNPELGIVKF